MEKKVYFKYFFETIPNFRKTVLLLFSTKNDIYVFHGCGFLIIDINGLCIDSKKFFLGQNEEYLEDVKNHEESNIVKFLNK